MQFTLVVDDFGIKYTGKHKFDHLVKTLRKYYKLTIDETGGLYCGITLNWNYVEGCVDLSMPDYKRKLLEWYFPKKPIRPKNSPYPCAPINYGKKVQEPIQIDTEPLLESKGTKKVQQVLGSALYYGRAVDLSNIMELSDITSNQSKSTAPTEKLTD